MGENVPLGWHPEKARFVWHVPYSSYPQCYYLTVDDSGRWHWHFEADGEGMYGDEGNGYDTANAAANAAMKDHIEHQGY